MSELTQCFQGLACEQDDDSCLAPVSEANGSAVFSGYKAACDARRSACESELTSEGFFCFKDELGVATDAAIRENQDCLKRDCNDIRACMDAISYRNHCKG